MDTPRTATTAIEQAPHPDAIAGLYDAKTRDASGLNARLAAGDLLFFNHNGVVNPARSLDADKPLEESVRLRLLHELEADLVTFGLDYLGEPGPSSVVLDAGCGAGGGGIMIHRRFGCHVEGFTLSREQARFANAAATILRVDGHVRFNAGDLRELPLESGRYDAIWACESTEHFDDLGAFFARFRTLLKPGGRIVVIAWCAGEGQEAERLKARIDDHYLTTIHPPAAYLAAAREAGLALADRVDLTDRTTPYWRLRESSQHATGSERFMGDGYATRLVTYELFALEKS